MRVTIKYRRKRYLLRKRFQQIRTSQCLRKGYSAFYFANHHTKINYYLPIVFFLLTECLDESKDSLLRTLKRVEKKFIELVIEKNISIIRQVSDIPRLYRRTNREAPTQPCPYVASLFSPIENLQNSHSSHASNWIPAILSAFTSA